jgi:hypothetical protein
MSEAITAPSGQRFHLGESRKFVSGARLPISLMLLNLATRIPPWSIAESRAEMLRTGHRWFFRWGRPSRLQKRDALDAGGPEAIRTGLEGMDAGERLGRR